MKTVLILAALACLPAYANTPKKEPLVKYTGLWTNSPFTSKPPVVEGPAAVNPFEDFTLTGIAPVPGGHRITIVSKKNPEIKRVIEPGGSDEFKVISVQRNPEKELGTVVILSSGTTQGSVTFEPDLITLNAAPTAPIEQQGGENIQAEAEQPPNAIPPPGMRPPRPRITPPPTPAANQQQPIQPSGDRRDNRRR